MRYNITGRNLEVTEGIKEAIYDKLSRLDKYFTEDTQARITLSIQKDIQKIEVTIPTKNGLIRAEESSMDMYSSIDMVADIIEKQIKKYKSKLIDKKQSASSFSDLFINDESYISDEEIKIVKSKRFAIKPMDAEEACLQMEMLGHNFYVFLDADTEMVSVVYKRKDGKYGIIEPEI